MWNVKTENREAREARRISGSKKLTGPCFSFTAHLVFHMGTHEEWAFHFFFFCSDRFCSVSQLYDMEHFWLSSLLLLSKWNRRESCDLFLSDLLLNPCYDLKYNWFFDIVSLNVGTLNWFSDHSINFYALYNSLNIYSSTIFPSLLRSAQNLIVDLYGF